MVPARPIESTAFVCRNDAILYCIGGCPVILRPLTLLPWNCCYSGDSGSAGCRVDSDPYTGVALLGAFDHFGEVAVVFLIFVLWA